MHVTVVFAVTIRVSGMDGLTALIPKMLESLGLLHSFFTLAVLRFIHPLPNKRSQMPLGARRVGVHQLMKLPAKRVPLAYAMCVQ